MGLRPGGHTHASETKAHVNHIRNHGGRNPQQRGEQGRLQFLSTCPRKSGVGISEHRAGLPESDCLVNRLTL
jgi:hypothetical protein